MHTSAPYPCRPACVSSCASAFLPCSGSGVKQAYLMAPQWPEPSGLLYPAVQIKSIIFVHVRSASSWSELNSIAKYFSGIALSFASTRWVEFGMHHYTWRTKHPVNLLSFLLLSHSVCDMSFLRYCRFMVYLVSLNRHILLAVSTSQYTNISDEENIQVIFLTKSNKTVKILHYK